MPHFIHQVAQYIQANYKDTSNLTVVLPSQRAKKYIQEELFDVLGKPYFSPNFITINTWIKDLVPYKVVSSVQLLFELYEVHKELADNPESFDEFMRWGKLLLNDCDEIDRYLIEPNQLFKNLRDVKEIENWSFDSEKELTESQKKFMEFWDKLGGYYSKFNSHLQERGLCYMGSAYRYVSNNVELVFTEQKDTHFLFVGFNALSPAEISIMKQVVKMGRGNVMLEGDDFFVNDELHEAGMFLRDLKLQIPESILCSENRLLTEKKSFEIISCSQPTSQVKAGMTILKSLSEDEMKNTLLLLADESLIVPAIKHIPADVGEANITLGLPLKNTLLRTWIDLLFDIQDNINYFNTSAAYHKTLSAFLQHPFFRKFISDVEVEKVEEILKNIIKFNKLFSKVDFPELSERSNQLIKLAFTDWKGNWQEALLMFRSLNQMLFPVFDKETDLLERSAITQFDEAIREITVVFNETIPEFGLHIFKQLVNPFWMNKSVAYYGNPTEGLQIMGLLETRMLEFDQIIVIGLNEGKMPPSNLIQTIIPMDLRRYFGLPTPSEKDALFAHHFYRLLPGVKKCWITYNNSPGEGLVANEPSRYLRQLELELVRENDRIEWKTSNFELELNELNKGSIEIPASKEATKVILDYFEKGISASALNKFLTCPLDFYYRYILGLHESDEVEEEMESSTFGEIVHNTLEEMYKPFQQKKLQVTEFDIDKMLKEYPLELNKQFVSKFNSQKEVFEKGRNYLSFEMAAYQIERFLKFERTMLQENPDKKLFILSLEEKLETTLSVEWQGKSYPLKVKGLIDRVDSWGERTRIIDYKTGKCTAENVTIKFDTKDVNENYHEEIPKKLDKAKYVLQLGIYNLLYHKSTGLFAHEAGIISLTQLSAGFQMLNDGKNKLLINDEHTQLVESLINRIAENILESNSFIHNNKAKYCEYCEK